MNFQRVIRFGLVGFVNTGIYYGFYLLLKIALPYILSHIIAFAISVIGSYFLNCYFTFHSKPSWKTFLIFPLSTLSNFAIQSLGLAFLVELLNVNEKIAPLIAAVAAIPITFIVTQYIFRNRTIIERDTKDHDVSHPEVVAK